MDKINWFERKDGKWEGFVLPRFTIYEDLAHRFRLYIFDDRPQNIIIKSVRAGKIKAKKYLDKKLYEEFGE